MTAPSREIQETTEHNYARWRHCFVAAFFVATVGITADAEPVIFNDPTPTFVNDGDRFGTSVALDGNHVLIGATHDDTDGSAAGQAHLFNATTGNLLQTFNAPTPAGQHQFGNSVALDGNNVLVGESFDRTNGTSVGQTHLFDALTGNWLQTFDVSSQPLATGDWAAWWMVWASDGRSRAPLRRSRRYS